MEKQPAHCRGGVNALRMADEIDAESVELGKRRNQALMSA